MQLTIPILMGATLIIALLLRWDYTWLTALIIEFIVLYLCVEVLVRNLPSGIRSRLADNCKRIDGSWSVGRERAEIRSLNRLRWRLTWVFLLVAVSGNLVFLVLNGTMLVPSDEPPERPDRTVMSFGLVLFVWLSLSCLVVKAGYFYLMKELSSEVDDRSQQYKRRDMQSVQEGKVLRYEHE